MKITALSGAAINGNPILNNRAYSGVVTLKQGEAVVVASELDKSQSRAISGTPGISEIPGLNNLTGQRCAEELRHAADHHHAPRDSRHAGQRPHADDARGTERADTVDEFRCRIVVRRGAGFDPTPTLRKK